jgi:hypothetical protein
METSALLDPVDRAIPDLWTDITSKLCDFLRLFKKNFQQTLDDVQTVEVAI